jgi:hypothetical protein
VLLQETELIRSTSKPSEHRAKMYVNEEDVPLIAPNRVVVSNRPRIWKFITASVVMSAVGFAVVSINGRNASTNPANSALSEEKTIMMKKGTLRYGDLSDVEKSSLFATFKADFERKVTTDSFS